MKKNVMALTAAALTISLTLCTYTPAFADTFKDVPSTYWAYSSIDSITSKGYILGDLSGNFNPESYIDKFETSKILAKVAGYTITAGEAAYAKQQQFMSQYPATFSRWNSTSDREVAFLLEKGILKPEDLNQFVIKSVSGTEQLRALSREELAIFIVRLMGKEDEASKTQISSKFADDSSITADRKSSVYYLKNVGVISGGTDNKFVPKGAVTKASFCVFLDNALKNTGITTNTSSGANGITDPVATITSTPQTNTGVNNIQTITGTFDKYFESLNVVQISINGTQKHYKLKADAEIQVDNAPSTVYNLTPGMILTIITNNQEIMQISAVTQTVTTNTQTTENEFTSTTTEFSTETTTVNTTESNGNYNGKPVTSISEPEKTVTGTLIAKRYDNVNGVPVLTINSAAGEIYELIVTNESSVYRNSDGEVFWDELKIGDAVQAKTEYNNIKEFYATGAMSKAEGKISGITIDENSASIDVKLDGGTLKTYTLNTEYVDIYGLRIGDEVKLNLNSSEVETLWITDKAELKAITGYIERIKDKYIYIRNAYDSDDDNIKINYDKNTKFINAKTGKEIDIDDLDEDMKIYAVCEKSFSDGAKTITLLSD